MRDALRRRLATLPWQKTRSLLIAGSLAGGIACSTDTVGLERREPGDAPAAGAGAGPIASGGASGSAGTTGGAGSAPSPTDASSGGAIEIVHGLIDGGSLFVCLRDTVSGEPLADDAPEPAEGVPYGRGWSLATARWDVAARDVELELFVVVPDVAPQSCSALREGATVADPLPLPTPDAGASDAGPAPEPPFPLQPEIPRRAGALRLAPGVLRAGGHYALVAAGCTGRTPSSADDVCGPVDALLGVRQTLILAEIADQLAAADDVFGLQFLNASRALSRADLVLQWESQRQPSRVSSDVGFGAVRPREAAGVDGEPVGLELHVRGESLASFTQAWRDAVEASSGGAFARGSNYLTAYVGPLPGAVIAGVSPPRFVLIRGRSGSSSAALAQ